MTLLYLKNPRVPAVATAFISDIEINGGNTTPPFGRLSISQTDASSASEDANNTTWPGTGKHWMSDVDSGASEWIEYTFQAGAMITGIYLHADDGKQGVPVLEGMMEGADVWTTIHSIGTFETASETNSLTYYSAIKDTRIYEKARVKSSPVQVLKYYQVAMFGMDQD